MGLLIGGGIGLFFLCVYLLLYLWALKGELCKVKAELGRSREQSYNRQITVSLFDRDLSNMVVELNDNLDYQKRLKLQAEQAEEQLKKSISDISHDLRTPLTVINGNLQMLYKEEISKKGQEYLQICLEKSEALKTMINDFFELSVLESDHTPLELKQVDVTSVLMQFLVDNEAVIRANGLTPEINIPEKAVWILANEQMLVRMLGNLLNNVIKYAKDTFMTELVCMEDNRCRITFANALQESSKPNVEQIFERTYRGDQARHEPGAGLGLYIVKLLAGRQGAEVQARQENEMLLLSLFFSISSNI